MLPAPMRLAILGLLATAPALAAQAPDSAQVAAAVESYMRAAVQHDQFSGTILVARDGRPVVAKGYGMANWELRVPATTATVYRIASLTKQFTAVAVLRLRDRGALQVSDPLCKYLNDCPSAWASVTLRHLLSHTSGIPNHTSLPAWDDSLSLRDLSRRDVIDLVRDLPLQFAPGTRHRYSNANYHLLGLIIEQLSGTTYEQFLRDELLRPLGMHHTGMHAGRALVPQRANGYYWALTDFINATRENAALAYASGGLFSTVEDLLRWDQALYEDRVLSAKSRQEMFTAVLNDYGYGIIVAPRHGRPAHSHSGSLAGFSSFLLRFPEDRVTVIVLSNSDRTSASKVAANLSAILLGRPYRVPEAQPYALVATVLERDGIDAAVRRARALRRTEPDREELGEDLLNEIGYDLITLGRVADALAVFIANVADFPNSANAHDSLGEAYAMHGDVARAIASYERALAIRPGLPSAVEALARLRRSQR